MCRLAIGFVRKTHGTRGSLRVRSLSGETDHFRNLKKIFVKEGTTFVSFRVEAVKVGGDDVFMKLEGIDNPEDGKKLHGKEIWTHREFASPLQDGEYYVADLCCCEVWCHDEIFGTVQALIEGGATDIMEVISPSGQRVMIPLIEEYIERIDIAGRKIHVKQGCREL